MSRLRYLSAGESHGPRLTAILDGLPAGVPLDPAELDALLARRQRGDGAGGRMKIEHDRVQLSGGWVNGRTTGGPLALSIPNLDWERWRDKDVPAFTRPRPGHADLSGAVKFGHRELRLSLERASARETAMRVAAGGACLCALRALGVEVGGYAVALGAQALDLTPAVDAEAIRARWAAAGASRVACPDPTREDALRAEVREARHARDTVGGVLEVVALGLPAGLGSYTQWDRRLDAKLAFAVLSVPAFKGVEVGAAFTNAGLRGTAVHDPVQRDAAGNLTRPSNRAGGLEGGVTNGMPLVIRAAMKPLSSTLTPLPTVDLADGAPSETVYERSDVCALPRAVPILECMLGLVLLDALLEKVGGDSWDEVSGRVAGLRRCHLDDLPQDGVSWSLGYRE
ncbi:MAG: chorismate synthase [Planctomycetes bacterium]|nr:chorismate synthase [Planctomycetota bacterium]